MASTPIIFGFRHQSEFLAAVGVALLQVKNARKMKLMDMAEVLGRGDDMVAKYIAGEAEMGMVAWNRAVSAWPELLERLNEVSRLQGERS